ncbi:MAG: HEAT repeat domain-containing protein [Pseudomonadales bacterium]|nr:HEAT repeat domain-containing protein [Pseudomonadales bacterium]
MSKLVEREPAPGATSLSATPALAVQFFLIPLAVVGMVVLVYGGFRMLLTNERTPEEFLSDVQTGGRERRWPAAYELSRLMSDPDVESQYPNLGSAIVRAFENSEGDDPRVRRYLALAVGRLSNPPADATRVLVEGLDDPDTDTKISVIWALASLGDPSVTDVIASMYGSEDPGVRKMAVYALGGLGTEDLSVLRGALDDPIPDVQWNAAVALARQGGSDGMTVLRRMLDRDYVERTVTRVARVDATLDPVSEVMISGLQAVAALRSTEMRDTVTSLIENDVSLNVREVAMRTLELLDSDVTETSDVVRYER